MKKTCYIKWIIILSLISLFTHAQILLDSLSLAQAKIYTNLDSALAHPDQVYKLILKKRKYKHFPKEILLFKNLQYLDISKNDIKEIPAEIEQLSMLQYFACHKCRFSQFPKNLTHLSHLYYLDLSQNNIDSIPDEIDRLKNLKILDLWDNNLSYFPHTLSNLEHLKILDLRSILLNQKQQSYIQSLLPHTKIYFSPPCQCSW